MFKTTSYKLASGGGQKMGIRAGYFYPNKSPVYNSNNNPGAFKAYEPEF